MLADREETIFCLTGFLCTIKYGSMLKSRLRKRKKKDKVKCYKSSESILRGCTNNTEKKL